MQSFDLKCKVEKNTWDFVGPVEYCKAQTVSITSRNEEVTSVDGRTDSTSLTGLWFNNQTVNYLPKGIDKFFPNLKALVVSSAQLKSLTQVDLKSLTQLVFVNFVGNDVESLDGDLFEFSPKIKFLGLSSNKLKYVGDNFLSNLKDLQASYFGKNPCIDFRANSSSEIPALVQKLKMQCNLSVLINENEQLKKEIADLKNKTNQQLNELNSTNSELIATKAENTRQANSIKQLNATILEFKAKPDLQEKIVATLEDDNTKLKRWLKSCDGNLNAATGILFKTSDHKQIFTQPSTESLGLVVVVDGLKATAKDLVISSPGVMLNSVKYANGSNANINATELYIDHQQTLFLPTNISQHFPALQILSVTSSGLIQIDLQVFSLMNNLKVLNLTSNKLQEIQLDTFDQLKLLESLDLSSNNLKTLETNMVSGLEKLQVLNLAENRLEVISTNLLEPLKVLKSVNLTNNVCINLSFPEVTLKEVKDQIIKSCIAPVEIECDMRETDCRAVNLMIMQPKTKISKLKNNIGFDSFTFSVIDQGIAFLPSQLSKTFTKLHVLIVDRSKLTALKHRDFEGLTNLERITIVYNNISLIEFGVFDDVPQLEHLNLSSNNILTLPAMIFVKLTKLKTLDLSDNQLQSFLLELFPSRHVIVEFHIKDNAIIKSNLANSINLKKFAIIDLTHNVCINFKYDKDKPGSNSLPALYKALQVCQVNLIRSLNEKIKN